MFSLKEMVQEISKASGLTEEDVRQRIEDKQTELSGLVSEEGAAYIVGKELGVSLLKENVKHSLKIRNVLPGMRSVDVTGKILRISARRDFEREGKVKGVVNVILGDETGVMRLSLWDQEIEMVEKLDLKENDAISIMNGYVRESGRGEPEVRLGRMGRIAKSDADIPSVAAGMGRGATPKNISDLGENEYGQVRASLVQVFKRNPLYEVCPTCDSRLENDGESWKCKDHGKVEPKYNFVISGIIDDGSANMRVVFFRDIAQKIIGQDAKGIKALIAKGKGNAEAAYDSVVLGREFVITGKVKKNQFNDKMEIVANSADEVSPKEEAKSLVRKIEALRIHAQE